MRAARDRVLAALCPTSSSPSSTDELDSSNYLNNHPNIIAPVDVLGKDVSIALNSLRLVNGFSLYDLHSGCTVPCDSDGKRLVELAVNSILLDRIELSKTIETCARDADPNLRFEILNFGPGTGIARAALRNLKDSASSAVSLVDASVSRHPANLERGVAASENTDSQDPIAIVGMAVNFPGARDASELWRVLEHGLNTVEEVCFTSLYLSLG